MFEHIAPHFEAGKTSPAMEEPRAPTAGSPHSDADSQATNATDVSLAMKSAQEWAEAALAHDRQASSSAAAPIPSGSKSEPALEELQKAHSRWVKTKQAKTVREKRRKKARKGEKAKSKPRPGPVGKERPNEPETRPE